MIRGVGPGGQSCYPAEDQRKAAVREDQRTDAVERFLEGALAKAELLSAKQ